MAVNMADKVCVSVHRDKGKEAAQGSFQQGETKGKHTQEIWFSCRKENDSKMQKIWLWGQMSLECHNNPTTITPSHTPTHRWGQQGVQH